MFRKVTGVLAVAAASVAVGLVAPSSALACNNDSATCVYSQPGVNASGGKSAGPGAKPRHVSKKVNAYLAKAGKDAPGLRALVQQQSLGTPRIRHLEFNPATVAQPSALSAVFDLGAGPVALVAILIGSALAIVLARGWHGWRRWRATI